jgi:hypothetical protein
VLIHSRCSAKAKTALALFVFLRQWVGAPLIRAPHRYHEPSRGTILSGIL